MNNTVSGILTQHCPYNTTFGYPCESTIPCPNNEWGYQCVNDTHLCSQIDPNLCPQIDGPSSRTWETSNSDLNSTASGRNVVCTYNLSQFRRLSDVQTWIATFGSTGPMYNNIMESFCLQPSFNCNANIATLPGLTGCSRINENSQIGSYCRSWYDSLPITNVSVENFCTSMTGSHLRDCLCYNKQYIDPEYNNINNALPRNTPAACWYKPCSDKSYLISFHEKTNLHTCPNGICTQINACFNDFDSLVTCNKLSTNSLDNVTTGSTINWWWVIISSVILLLILGLIIFIVIYYNKEETLNI